MAAARLTAYTGDMTILLLGSAANSSASSTGSSGDWTLVAALLIAGIVLLTYAFHHPSTERV